jgi:SAM-dependent methyltransferase
MPNRSEHWDKVYDAREDEALTWHEAEPELSHELVTAHSRPGDRVIDVGGGTSRLVDALVRDGYGRVTVLDVSEAALATAKERLGPLAEQVTWIAADITAWTPPETWDLWHDRAVFHFLIEPSDRAAYVAAMDAALAEGGTGIIATFAEDGPEQCSGLPVMRYSSDVLAQTLEAFAPGRFTLVESRRHMHVTPKGNEHSFQVGVFRKRSRT